jgi:hypothetical protein
MRELWFKDSPISTNKPGMMECICNPSYSRGIEDSNPRQAMNKNTSSYPKNN